VPLKRLIQQALAVLRTLPGRLFLLSAGLLIVIGALQLVAGLPPIVDLFRKVVVIAFLGSAAAIFLRTAAQTQRQFLWAVRRKLILSYFFFGVLPVALIMVFVLIASIVLYINIATYLFQSGYQNLIDDIAVIAETTAVEIGKTPSAAAEVIARKFATRKTAYPALSLVPLHRLPQARLARPEARPHVVFAED